MKKLVMATLLSSLLVAVVSLADYFVWQELDPSSELIFWFLLLRVAFLAQILSLLPAAIAAPTTIQSATAVVLAACFGVVTAAAVVVLQNWGSLFYIGTEGSTILSVLQNHALPAAIALAISVLWRHWRKLRMQNAAKRGA